MLTLLEKNRIFTNCSNRYIDIFEILKLEKNEIKYKTICDAVDSAVAEIRKDIQGEYEKYKNCKYFSKNIETFRFGYKEGLEFSINIIDSIVYNYRKGYYNAKIDDRKSR